MRRFLVFLLVAPAVLVGVIVAGILASGSGSATKPQAPQQLTMVIQAAQHLPYSFAIRPGVAVRLTIVNREAEGHTFTIPGLGVNQMVPPARNGVASRVVVTFTAPYGVFRWVCEACPDESGDIYSVITKRGPDGVPPGGFHWSSTA